MSQAHPSLQPYLTLLAKPRTFRASFPDGVLPRTLARLALHTALLVAICLVLAIRLQQALPPLVAAAELSRRILDVAVSAVWIASIVWLVFRSREPNWLFYLAAELASVNIMLLGTAATLGAPIAMLLCKQFLDPSSAVLYSLTTALAVLGAALSLVGLFLLVVSVPRAVAAAARVNGLLSFVVLLLANATVSGLYWALDRIAAA